MSGIGIPLLAFIVAISVLVAVHEFGHFWVARKLGIKVLRFSIGFGKPIWSRVFGPDKTEFAVAAIPLGGYVKMLDEREGEVAAEELGRSFNRQPLWVRSAVLVAGPLFNFIFAIFAYWLMFSYGIPGVRPVIDEVTVGSYAADAGLAHGDEIYSIAGDKTQTWDSVAMKLLDTALGQEQVEIQVKQSDGQQRNLMLDLRGATDVLSKGDPLSNLGITIMRAKIPAIIERTVAEGAAAAAGIIADDEIVSADGQVIDGWADWVSYVRARPQQKIQVVVLRAGTEHVIRLQPRAIKDDGEIIGQIGAYVRKPEPTENPLHTVVRYSPLPALQQSVTKTWDMSALTLRTLWGMVSGRTSIKNISGPLTIAQYAGYSAQVGFSSFLKFLAIVSISLGVLNLLPIPILDGGHLLYNFIEWISGKPLSDAAMEFGQRLGIVALLGLMGLAFYNDLNRLFGAG